MKRTKVESSNIASVGYDPLDGIMEIEFNSGAIYQYEKVPYRVYKVMMSSDSVGKYFNAHIKSKYNYRRCLAPSVEEVYLNLGMITNANPPTIPQL